MSEAGWIMLAGALAAGSCGIVGSFLLLRRLAMLGDAISHAVLPGIAMAFLLTSSRDPVPMLLGAGALGLVTAGLTDWLHRTGRVQQDAAIGVTFTWLFAIGVILISAFAGQVDLDQECVLYGEIAYVPLDHWLLADGRSMGPRAIWVMGGVFALNVVWVTVAWKELRLCAFDPELAASLGLPVVGMHVALMAATSLTTVAAFESVGAILVVAMLVGPAATAFLLTDRLARMVPLAVAVGAVASVLGYLLAHALDASIAGCMALAIGLLFALAALFSPRHGVVTRAWRQRRLVAESGGVMPPALQ